MNQKNGKAIFGALLVALTLACGWVAAQEINQEPDDLRTATRGRIQRERLLEGVWDVRVTNRDCNTGAALSEPFRVMNMFNSGGTLLETGGRPTLRGPAFGTWEYLGGRRFYAVFRFFRYNADGTPAGSRKVVRTIEVSRDGDEFTATASFEVYDTEDRVTQAGCATETAKRLE